MPTESVHFPATPIALKMAVSIGIGMLVGMEREWSTTDAGVDPFDKARSHAAECSLPSSV